MSLNFDLELKLIHKTRLRVYNLAEV